MAEKVSRTETHRICQTIDSYAPLLKSSTRPFWAHAALLEESWG